MYILADIKRNWVWRLGPTLFRSIFSNQRFVQHSDFPNSRPFYNEQTMYKSPPPLLPSAFLAYEMNLIPFWRMRVIPFSPSSPLSHLRGAPRLERSHAGAPRGIKGRSKC